ncbi:MAG TPA: hypothetical protein VI036_13265 [Propionibacteriaceae bacterium]
MRPVDVPPPGGRGAVRRDLALLSERSRSITVREWSRLRVGWHSTFGGLQLLSARRSGRETHPVPRHFAAVAAGVAVRRPGGDYRRDLFVGDAELTAAQLGVRGGRR